MADTESKFTSGPWRVSVDGIWARSKWNAEVKIATVTICSPMNGIDWQANAALIAAAPDMLAALLKTRDNLEGLARCDDAGVFAAMLRRVEGAISKAVPTPQPVQGK